MTWVAGVDGCRRGWFRACRKTTSGELRFDVVDTTAEILTAAPEPEIVALDMPIGLPSSGARECDRAARRCLGPRRSSVFPAPVRAAIGAGSREEASTITARIDGRCVSAQAWAIFPKIRSVDELLAASVAARQAIREVHPEVSFWAWNDRRPMKTNKKKPDGQQQRLALAEAWLGAGLLERARSGHLKKELADDDVLDAIAGLWTAHRIAAGTADSLPLRPPADAAGLPMQIVF